VATSPIGRLVRPARRVSARVRAGGPAGGSRSPPTVPAASTRTIPPGSSQARRSRASYPADRRPTCGAGQWALSRPDDQGFLVSSAAIAWACSVLGPGSGLNTARR